MNTFKHHELRCNCTHSWNRDYTEFAKTIGTLPISKETLKSFNLKVTGTYCKKCGLHKWTFTGREHEHIQT